MAIPLFASVIVGMGGTHKFGLNLTSVSDTAAGGWNVGVTVTRDGDFLTIGDTAVGGPDADDWVIPRHATIGDDFETRCTVNSGSGPNGAFAAGVWHPITSNIGFNNLSISPGSMSGNWTVEIRRASTAAVVASATFNVTGTGS